MRAFSYDRLSACDYAEKWAFSRNPTYYNFDELGGDCTNFVSQCIFAGAGVMNYTPNTGWFYLSLNNRAPAWSGVEFLQRFLLNNTGAGPFGRLEEIKNLSEGDVIFLNNGYEFYHSLIVVGKEGDTPLIAAHTNDAYMRRLDTYYYDFAQGVHILGVN